MDRNIIGLMAGLALLIGAPVQGQEAGTITGVVRDEAGAPVAEVQVVAPALRTSAVTDAAGRFSVRGGISAELRFSRVGYAPVRRRGVPGAHLEVMMAATPLTLPAMEVTASAGGRDPLAVTQATSQLSGRELEREMGSSLAQTLRTQPGVAVRFMGPAATMPVLRGLTGDRVLVLQDGQRTADLAGSADDHGVTIDPLAAQRVEIVRGPATLLYGNNAMGGVVNVISGDLPAELPGGLEGSVGLQSESAFPGGAGSVRAAMPLGAGWVVVARGAARRTAEMRIPDDPVLGSRLANTDAGNVGASLGLGRIGARSSASLGARFYDFAYGLPVPPGLPPVGLDGRRYELNGRAELERPVPAIRSLRVDGTAQDYRHVELDEEADEALQTFDLHTRTGNLVVQQGGIGPITEGAWGMSVLAKDYAATGPQALTPPAGSLGLGIFGFQEVELIPGRLALQAGGRVDGYRISSRASEKFGAGIQREFRALSGALGLRVPIGGAASVSMHLGRSFRAPTVEELFSRAAHAGTGAVELGEPTLRAERGVSAEGVFRVQNARWSGQAAVFRNSIRDYVHLAARGDTVLYGATLPVLAYAQTGAVLRGVEGSLEWAATRQIVLGVMGDYLHASQTDGTPLSFMPPARLGMTLRWEGGVLAAGGDLHHELEQDRVGSAGERTTPAHTVLRAHTSLRFRVRDQTHSLTLRAENLGNELHREATSRVKDFAPGPGRNLSLLYRVYY